MAIILMVDTIHMMCFINNNIRYGEKFFQITKIVIFCLIIRFHKHLNIKCLPFIPIKFPIFLDF